MLGLGLAHLRDDRSHVAVSIVAVVVVVGLEVGSDDCVIIIDERGVVSIVCDPNIFAVASIARSEPLPSIQVPLSQRVSTFTRFSSRGQLVPGTSEGCCSERQCFMSGAA